MDEYHGPPKIKHLKAPVGYFLLNIPHCQSDKWVFVHDIIHETPGLSAWAECLTWLLCLGCCTFARLMTRTDTHTHTYLKKRFLQELKLRRCHGTDMTVAFLRNQRSSNVWAIFLDNFELLLELETWFFRGVHLERPEVTLIIWLTSNQICRFLVVWTMKSQRVWMNLDVLPLTMLYFVLLCLIVLYKTICSSIGKKMESFMKLFKR